MLKSLSTIMTVLIVLFFYIHVVFQLKKCNDLEILELDEIDKLQLEEICNYRQPTIFSYQEPFSLGSCKKSLFADLYQAFDVNVVDKNIIIGSEKEIYRVPISLKEALLLIEKDNNGIYRCEENQNFLKETSLDKKIKMLDEYLRPPLTTCISYDLSFGSDNSFSFLHYNTCFRTYILVTEGEVKIRLTPPKSDKYLGIIKDYSNLEFYSSLDIWNNEIVHNELAKVKFMDVILEPGKGLYIPAYWLYSILYNKNASVITLKYTTLMNTFSLIPNYFIKVLQQNNLKTISFKKYNVDKNINENEIKPLEEIKLDNE